MQDQMSSCDTHPGADQHMGAILRLPHGFATLMPQSTHKNKAEQKKTAMTESVMHLNSSGVPAPESTAYDGFLTSGNSTEQVSTHAENLTNKLDVVPFQDRPRNKTADTSEACMRSTCLTRS